MADNMLSATTKDGSSPAPMGNIQMPINMNGRKTEQVIGQQGNDFI